MLDGLGPSNVEGFFKKCCETTLSVCKENTEALTSVLETLIHELNHNEPKISVQNQKRSLKLFNDDFRDTDASNCSIFTDNIHQDSPYNKKSFNILSHIKKKLAGCITASLSTSLPLSIKGQVHDLIEQATNIENLSKMYIGWGAYL